MLEMFLAGITLDEVNGSPILVLTDKEKQLALPIWISEAECKAIIFALGTVKTDRPITYELMLNTIKSLGASLSRVLIAEVDNSQYYALVTLTGRKPGSDEESAISIDARVADAIALAIKSRAPILVAPQVIAGAAMYTNAKKERADAEQFADFVDHVMASDFNELRLNDR